VVDAGEIFLNLCGGEIYPFPDSFEDAINIVGSLVARRAISERRNIVVEIIGADYEAAQELIDAMETIGYFVSVHCVTLDIEEAQRRNLERDEDNISCYYSEPYQQRWLLEAVSQVLTTKDKNT
jgi:hypothetical protein